MYNFKVGDSVKGYVHRFNTVTEEYDIRIDFEGKVDHDFKDGSYIVDTILVELYNDWDYMELV